MKTPQIHTQRGFTLLELLVVIAVIGVLAGLAVSRYQAHIIAANRQAAVATLQLAQQSMERGFLRSSSYQNALDATQLAAINARVLASHIITQATTATTYTLTATPTATNPDALCGVLGIDQTGLRTITGTGNIAECWGN